MSIYQAQTYVVVIFNAFVCFRYCIFHTEEVCMPISLRGICQIIGSSHDDHFIVVIIILWMRYPILPKPHRILLASYQPPTTRVNRHIDVFRLGAG